MTELRYEDRADFDDADRGRIGALEPCVVTGADGRVVWDNDSFGFLDGPCPDTANPSLWRQSQLCAKHGLYEVTDGIYQVRGLDLSNMTLVEGDTGVIVIDPLVSKEVAAAALQLYRVHRGERPVTGVIYTHSHIDHFGGVGGVVTGEVPILAPEGFLAHAVAENVYAGTAMLRRGMYHTGSPLPRNARGLIGTGLGQTASTGEVTLLAPTVYITHTGQEEVVDGVRIVFQVTPNTEAPSEMNFFFPDRAALCMAENATHNLHNVLTLRGAVVRDARMWSRYLNEAITLFGDRAGVVFASHHWPAWGRERIIRFLSQQRDLYAYLHDQTLRMLNQGLTGAEIAETIELPPELDTAWHARGYYGSVSHNVKAVYQRYLGWFDGNPAHLWEHPPAESARRYVDCMGGADEVVAKARGYADAGDLRFAAQLLNDAVFADPDHAGAKALLAEVYERLGFGAESGTWRNFYLTGAKELRDGISLENSTVSAAGMAHALTIEQLFDSIAIRVDGPRAWTASLTIDWRFTDLGSSFRMTLSNGALIHWPAEAAAGADLRLSLTKAHLLGILAGRGLEGVETEGDPKVLQVLVELLDEPDPAFAIVTP
ncbi:alkyl/aryl-sulfatase [Paractinoplanes atraurantiacus]|uniref:Linear primary-alkylsulfatase n=1 Tax=Paractinoplanes atraurantiacus TaxID=1036182 RepID=A0A285K4B1_9ACTN|nr:alkyl sulfatase dimerization domain-containing protein [Actinoplanes atraurantiacus]SNY66181.1 Alkyl sulfatase BDS1, metallo-beta-lactamase superfamily [Actinoplanes atraurantiacus]